jgi:hypothetical protein
MKFCAPSIISAALAVSALAQEFHIGVPTNGTTVKAGHKFTVEVVEPVRYSLAPSSYYIIIR